MRENTAFKKYQVFYGDSCDIVRSYAEHYGVDVEEYDTCKVNNAALCATCNREYVAALKAANAKALEYKDRYDYLTNRAVLFAYAPVVSMFMKYERTAMTGIEIFLACCTIAALESDNWDGPLF